MILYLIAAFALGIATGYVCACFVKRAIDKRSKREKASGDLVTKCFLEILRH